MRLSLDEFTTIRDRGNLKIAATSPHKLEDIYIQPHQCLQDTTIDIPSEDKEQEALVAWLRSKGIRHNATPNGGHRFRKTASILKATGTSPGFPDITIWPPLNSALPILFIEMKRTKGGRLSDYQREWLDYFSQLDDSYRICSTVCCGCNEAIEFIKSHGY